MLTARRTIAQDTLRQLVLSERRQAHPGDDPTAAHVAAAMYTGAMAELAQQWLAGDLGNSLGRRFAPRRPISAVHRLSDG